MSYYKNLLQKANENNIEIVDLDVANELSCCLNEEVSDQKFDEACSLIKDTYLKYEELTVWAVTKALLDYITDKDETLETFDLTSITRRELADEACYYL